jgi:hypothetical protein
MILAKDVGFHTPANVQYDWAETNFFSIYVPEPNLTVWLYTVARPGIGAMVVDIEAMNRIGRIALETLYFDFQQHLPIPKKLENYTLPNGLSLKTLNEPRDYQIDYIGTDNTEFHWLAKGLMEPFDIHDASMDPLASDDPNKSGFGAAYANHFDMTVHVTGTAKIRGKAYNVDCVTTMDHSWGPRNERGMKPMGWINGNFGKDLAFSTIWSFDQMKTDWQAFTLAHGYMLVNGEVRGLTRGRIRALRHGGPFPAGYEAVLVDKAGREYYFTGTVVAQTPWSCYSNIMAINSTVRWHYERREGAGLAQENWPLDLLTGRGLGY